VSLMARLFTITTVVPSNLIRSTLTAPLVGAVEHASETVMYGSQPDDSGTRVFASAAPADTVKLEPMGTVELGELLTAPRICTVTGWFKLFST